MKTNYKPENYMEWRNYSSYAITKKLPGHLGWCQPGKRDQKWLLTSKSNLLQKFLVIQRPEDEHEHINYNKI
jgi:hypothetical protein